MRRLSWNERVALVQAQRDASQRFMALAGLGTPPDPLIWPILVRFGALGIPTVGSCQGHLIPGDTRPPIAFVSVSQMTRNSAVYRRWLAAVQAFLAPAVMPLARFCVDPLSFMIQWHERPRQVEIFTHEQSRVLSLWADKLDIAGHHAVLTESEDWSVWVMPDVGVPDGVDPRRMETPFVAFLSRQGRSVDAIVRQRLSGREWTAIAQSVQWTETACQNAWTAFWQDWLVEQSQCPIRPRSRPLSGSPGS
ncbi:MAG: hypothetical protein C7B46_20660 [Sulfobacillus benefaciens]|uniref:Uncharacterized protein n=1 Tax=Sulfobacillus benefaciens TaxID=453960 RepID=A0A2T2WT23_9FIRM|nr:MAG: hypothetical protein C7B46_20660 [Sulfobacillus benefaciens]